MQDRIDRVAQQFAVMTDDQYRVRIFLQPRLKPQRAFQIEIIRRLVEQQIIRLREQRGHQRDPHAPAAGKFRHRAHKIVVGKPSPLRISDARAGALSASISINRS
jgi:hypothetical protein